MDIFYSRFTPSIRWINRFLSFSAYLGLAALIIEVGFYTGSIVTNALLFVDTLIAIVFIAGFALKVSFCKMKRFYLTDRWWETVLSVLLILAMGVCPFLKFENESFFSFLNFSSFYYSVRTAIKLYIVGSGILHGIGWLIEEIMAAAKKYRLQFHPAQFSLAGFLLIIIFGALFLMMPKSSSTGLSLNPIDALFTATSAVCVTGLVVVDTASSFSLMGQTVILALIQFGGLGVITVALFFRTFFSTGVGIRDRVLLQDVLSMDGLEKIIDLMRGMVLVVLSIELCGAAFLAVLWIPQGLPFQDLLFTSLFHSISAFCNAGFSLFPDSLMRFNQNIPVILVFSLLIISGGLGFSVLLELPRINPFRKNKQKKTIFKVHTKIVLIMTTVLIFGGFFLIALLERNNLPLEKLLPGAFFSSVTARTAGFNSLDFGAMSVPTVIIVIFLMFIGASPGSTGGGIKTTTFAVLWSNATSQITNHKRMILFKKYIPPMVMSRAVVILWFSIFTVFISTFLLTIFEDKPFLDLLFESVSAFATVGLSRGITADLTPWGKIILTVTMYIGRLGILPLALAITTPNDPLIKLKYPAETINVG